MSDADDLLPNCYQHMYV